MKSATPLTVVSGGAELPEYPAELCDPHLTADYFTMFWHDRWLSSRLHLTGTMAVQGAALNLFFLARKQVPVGSLPADEAMLSRLLRIDLAEWRGLMAQPVTPLHQWKQYTYEDGVVLGHPVVIEVARDALTKREHRKASSEAKSVAIRQTRLVELMRDLGCAKGLCEDKVLVERLDAWLLENHRGQRRRPQVDASLTRALDFAVKEGWIGRQNTGR